MTWNQFTHESSLRWLSTHLVLLAIYWGWQPWWLVTTIANWRASHLTSIAKIEHTIVLCLSLLAMIRTYQRSIENDRLCKTWIQISFLWCNSGHDVMIFCRLVVSHTLLLESILTFKNWPILAVENLTHLIQLIMCYFLLMRLVLLRWATFFASVFALWRTIMHFADTAGVSTFLTYMHALVERAVVIEIRWGNWVNGFYSIEKNLLILFNFFVSLSTSNTCAPHFRRLNVVWI